MKETRTKAEMIEWYRDGTAVELIEMAELLAPSPEIDSGEIQSILINGPLEYLIASSLAYADDLGIEVPFDLYQRLVILADEEPGNWDPDYVHNYGKRYQEQTA